MKKDKKTKLGTKDLIYAGAFAAIYIIAMFIIVMVFGMIPILYILAPLFVGILCATIYMMYISKVKKFGAILILAILFGTIMSSSGHGFTILMTIPIGLIAEFIAKKDGYNSKKMIVLSYMVFNLTMIAPFLSFYTATEKFIEDTREYYGEVYANTLDGLISKFGWGLYGGQVALAVLGALIGGGLAVVLFKKHFERAGLV